MCLEEFAPGERVQCGGGLVEDQDVRALADRQRECDLGLLAARELADPLVEPEVPGSQPLVRERVIPARVELATDGEHLADTEPWLEWMVLGDEPDPGKHPRRLRARRTAEDDDVAVGRLGQAHDQMQERRLTGAVRPDQRRDGPRGHLQRAIAE